MNSRLFSISIAFVLAWPPTHAQVADPLRNDLVQAGDAYLGKEMTAEAFINIARALKSSKPFNDEERSYLTDLSAKMPTELRTSVCPTMTEGLCVAQPVGLAASTLAEAEKSLSEDSAPEIPTPLPPTPKMDDGYARPTLWIIGIGLALLAGSAALKGKEVQIRKP